MYINTLMYINKCTLINKHFCCVGRVLKLAVFLQNWSKHLQNYVMISKVVTWLHINYIWIFNCTKKNLYDKVLLVYAIFVQFEIFLSNIISLVRFASSPLDKNAKYQKHKSFAVVLVKGKLNDWCCSHTRLRPALEQELM